MKRALYFFLFLAMLLVIAYVIFTGHQISEVSALEG